ncbi:hypothetical protein BC828DRAFT_418349 [Blastocladiella britannica]|nr:hypothetical protein BC828DRAFT_418349 [Blastocladiella britannica]
MKMKRTDKKKRGLAVDPLPPAPFSTPLFSLPENTPPPLSLAELGLPLVPVKFSRKSTAKTTTGATRTPTTSPLRRSRPSVALSTNSTTSPPWSLVTLATTAAPLPTTTSKTRRILSAARAAAAAASVLFRVACYLNTRDALALRATCRSLSTISVVLAPAAPVLCGLLVVLPAISECSVGRRDSGSGLEEGEEEDEKDRSQTKKKIDLGPVMAVANRPGLQFDVARAVLRSGLARAHTHPAFWRRWSPPLEFTKLDSPTTVPTAAAASNAAALLADVALDHHGDWTPASSSRSLFGGALLLVQPPSPPANIDSSQTKATTSSTIADWIFSTLYPGLPTSVMPTALVLDEYLRVMHARSSDRGDLLKHQDQGGKDWDPSQLYLLAQDLLPTGTPDAPMMSPDLLNVATVDRILAHCFATSSSSSGTQKAATSSSSRSRSPTVIAARAPGALSLVAGLLGDPVESWLRLLGLLLSAEPGSALTERTADTLCQRMIQPSSATVADPIVQKQQQQEQQRVSALRMLAHILAVSSAAVRDVMVSRDVVDAVERAYYQWASSSTSNDDTANAQNVPRSVVAVLDAVFCGWTATTVTAGAVEAVEGAVPMLADILATPMPPTGPTTAGAAVAVGRKVRARAKATLTAMAVEDAGCASSSSSTASSVSSPDEKPEDSHDDDEDDDEEASSASAAEVVVDAATRTRMDMALARSAIPLLSSSGIAGDPSSSASGAAEALVYALGSICSADDAARTQSVVDAGWATVVPHLLAYADPNVRRETLFTCYNVLAGTPAQAAHLDSVPGFAARIAKVAARDPDARVRGEAYHILGLVSDLLLPGTSSSLATSPGAGTAAASASVDQLRLLARAEYAEWWMYCAGVLPAASAGDVKAMAGRLCDAAKRHQEKLKRAVVQPVSSNGGTSVGTVAAAPAAKSAAGVPQPNSRTALLRRGRRISNTGTTPGTPGAPSSPSPPPPPPSMAASIHLHANASALPGIDGAKMLTKRGLLACRNHLRQLGPDARARMADALVLKAAELVARGVIKAAANPGE